MFANKTAITTLVKMDGTATDDEKARVLAVLSGKTEGKEERPEPLVVSFKDAADMLGYKSKFAVYAAVRNGRLKAVYAKADRKHATGVTMESVRRFVAGE